MEERVLSFTLDEVSRSAGNPRREGPVQCGLQSPDTDDDDHKGDGSLRLLDLEGQLLEERRKNAQLESDADDLRRQRRQRKANVDAACAAVMTALEGELNADALQALHDLADVLDG